MASSNAWGSEFLVNTTTTGDQEAPAVAGLADGRFVVVWENQIHLGGGNWAYSARAQVLRADGTPDGAEILVDTTTVGGHYQPSVAALDGGGYVVTWTDSEGDGSRTAIRAQAFGADGARLGAEFQVNTSTTDIQMEPTAIGLDGGGYVVCWSDGSRTGADDDGVSIRAQVFAADGTPQGGELVVNTSTFSTQFQPTVARLANGGFVVAWTDSSGSGGDTSGFAIRAQAFGADGTPQGEELQVNTLTEGQQFEPVVAGLADGGFVVTWTTFPLNDYHDHDVRGQVFAADGTKVGGEFVANTATISVQGFSTVTALPQGGFLVTWSDLSGTADGGVGEDISGYAIRARVFASDGTPSGEEFLVNTTVNDSQYESAATLLADGRVMVTWTDFSQSADDPQSGAIRAQILDLRTAAVTLAGTGHDDDFIGTGWGDTMAGAEGRDRLRGAGGDDAMTGGSGDDRLEGGAGDDRLDGGEGDDRLDGGLGDDAYVLDRAGDAVVEGADGGMDTVWAGFDYALGDHVETLRLTGTGDLVGNGSALANLLTGNAGANTLWGREGDDRIEGGAGGDLLRGNLGADHLSGGAGGDLLRGGDGADRLDGGTGSDRLRGGDGADSFVFAGGRDGVLDFQNNMDTLVFDDALWGGGARSAAQILAFAEIRGGAAVFDFGGGDVLAVRGVADLDRLIDDVAWT